jgi:hypothetical protein
MSGAEGSDEGTSVDERRDAWRALAWLLIVATAFWAAVAFHSGDDSTPRPTELVPATEKSP